MAAQRRKSGASGTAGSRGGKANEAGSLYRSGVAAYLAAHQPIEIGHLCPLIVLLSCRNFRVGADWNGSGPCCSGSLRRAVGLRKVCYRVKAPAVGPG